MLAYIWPLSLVVFSNIVYQICAKSVPGEVNTFASLTITYVVAAIGSLTLFFVLGGAADGGSLIKEFAKLNWASFVLGIVIIGLEAGWLFAYGAGWEVSKGFIVQAAALSLILVAVGYLLYNEAVTWNKLVGIVICLVGLVFLNLK